MSTFFSLLTYDFIFIVQEQPPEPARDPCLPSPCGPNSQCQNLRGNPSCSCLPNFEGSPPNCRPECTINEDCASNLACINQKCRDPCPGSCGLNANCQVIKHVSICSCAEGYTGNAFTQCNLMPPKGNFITVYINCINYL